VDFVVAFAIVLAMLFNPQLHSAGPAIAYAFIGLYALVHRRDFEPILTRRWPLMLIPALALASTVWSAYPAVTAKHALELSITVTGALLLSGSRRPDSILFGFCAAFSLYLGVALAFGHSVAVGTVTGAPAMAFTGLNDGKNFLGMTSAMGALLALYVTARTLTKAPLLSVLGAPILVVDLFLVYATQSAGAIIALTLAVAAFATIACLGLLRPRGRIIACSALISLLIAGGIAGYAFANSITAQALNIFHKDPTLTGRSYLWYRADGFIQEHPWLGRGYEAFWVQGNLDAEGMWQYAQLSNRGGFNFHNTWIELVVHLGWIGASLMLAIFLVGGVMLLRRSIRAPSLAAALWVAILTFHAARTPFESLMPASVDFTTLLLVVAMGFGFEPPAPPRARPAPQAAPLLWRRASARPLNV
jgi:exopolysaccharide production protein ExoQ